MHCFHAGWNLDDQPSFSHLSKGDISLDILEDIVECFSSSSASTGDIRKFPNCFHILELRVGGVTALEGRR